VTFAAVLGSAADRWLAAFSISVLVVLAGASVFRHLARTHARDPDDQRRGTRRRAGVLLAVGPVVGFLVAPGAGAHVGIAALGAVGLGAFGVAFERRQHFGRWSALAVAVVALLAVVDGLRFAPTGVGVLDVALGFAFLFGVTVAMDGLGNSDALVPGLGLLGGVGLLLLGLLGEQTGLADGAAGMLGASLAFMAFSLPPASLFAGRAGRLATGFALGVYALSFDPVPGPPARLVVALSLVAIPLLDVAVVTFDRALRRRPLLVDRHDHLVNRIAAYGASPFEAVGLLLGAQALLTVLAVLTARDGFPVPLLALAAVLLTGWIGGYAARAPIERMDPIGLSARAWWGMIAVIVVLAAGIVPIVVDLPDITDTMERGRSAAQRGLQAARVGDAAEAEIQFRRAAGYFDQARDQLHSVRYEAARLVPGVAPNLEAARTLADVGYDLAHNGEVVTAAVVPESLTIVDGRVPLDEVARVTPALERGRDTLVRSLERLRALTDEPYLLGPLRDAVAAIEPELARGAREAENSASAARLAPAIFGGPGDGPRRYLLVVQNPAENRGTGGLIGSYGILTADDGTVTVDRLERTGVWNHAAEASGSPEYDAPLDYRRRWGQFQPETHLQAVNMSPDFPTVGRVLASLAPAGGVGAVDGVIAIDPEGLAALLELTGPVTVAGWDEPITADNVVDVTLSEAYAEFASTPERADFLGDVADAVVAEATEGNLGEPANVARVLGDAARRGHIALWFDRPAEQRLASAVGADGGLRRGGDTLHVTAANVAANKLDYYLQRDLDYRIELTPADRGPTAAAEGSLVVRFANTAPDSGLPQIVAGPYEGGAPGEFRAGENVSYVSVYTPLAASRVTVDGNEVPVIAGRELGLDVYSTIVRVPADDDRTMALDLAGSVRMTRDGWYVLRLGSQPMVLDGRARVSVSVPDGYRITDATHLQRVFGGRATGILTLDRPTTVRVHVERAPGGLWGRLDGRE